ncbi:MAG: helix-turn-helix domain-containing protein, partial [bacterium]
NKKLEREIAKGNFREDLYYRLNVVHVYVPPLRERTDDIPVLADYFLEAICDEHGIPKKSLTTDVIEFLKSQTWKGNCRELRNIIERSVIVIKHSEINSKDILNVMEIDNRAAIQLYNKPLRQARDDFERNYILKLLSTYNWNLGKTAQVLEIDRTHLYRKIKQLNIEVP